MACQTGWHQYDRHCYYASGDYWYYTKANDDCVSKGSTLVSIHSEEENEFIRGKVLYFTVKTSLANLTQRVNVASKTSRDQHRDTSNISQLFTCKQ